MTLQEKTQIYKKDATSAKAVEAVASSSSSSNNNTRKMAAQNHQSHNVEHKRNCWKCDQKHPLKSCPAWGFKCQRCNELHHFTFCCRNKFQVQTNANHSNLNPYQQNQYPPPLLQTNNMGPPVSYYIPPPTFPSAPPLPPTQENFNQNSSSQSTSRNEQQNMRSQEISQKSKPLQSKKISRSQESTTLSDKTNKSGSTTNEKATNNNDNCKLS